MKAYVELVQRREREIGCDVLTHQKVISIVVAPEFYTEYYFDSGLEPTMRII